MNNTFEAFRRRRTLLSLVLMCCAMLLADLALAGQAQEASIIGQVTDESGAILPGVTVDATSPALQVRQVTDVTNERGEYRLTPLPIGTYTVHYELSGFGTLRRQDIRLTAGFTARVDVALKVGALAETITVSGAAPVVDVTSTSSRTQLTRETLELIPTGRTGLQSVMSHAPGVRTNLDFGGGSTANPEFRAFGQSGDSWTMIDGVVTTSPKTGNQSGNHFDYAAIEESTVQTVANNADSPTRGIQMNVILRSGGDDFHGGVFWAQSSQRLQSNNVDDALRAQGIESGNPIDARWDRSGELGGRIIRSKLWFYSSVRVRRENTAIVRCFKPDGSLCVNPLLTKYSTAKVSYQVSPANKLIGFWQHFHRSQQPGATQFVKWEARERSEAPVDTTKIEWQTARGNKFVSFQVGDWDWDQPRTGYSDEVATTDQLTQIVTGRAENAETKQHEGRKGVRGTLSWYKPGARWGNHDVKTGFDYTTAHADRQTWDRGAAQNYRLIFRNGVPFQFAAKSNPTDPHSPINYLGIYGQDSWTLARRLTLNLGVRYAHDNGFIPEQCRVVAPSPLDLAFPAQCFPRIQFKIWNPVVPRLHAAFDVTGDGRTVLKGGWGRFAQMRAVDELQMANELVDLVATYRWQDRNGNKRYDPGEVNFERNGPDFVSTRVQVGDALAGAVPNPNEKEPMSDDFSLSLERQLIQNLAVRITGIYSRARNTYRVQNNLRPFETYNIPIANADPGPDGRLGTADDPGTFITYYDFPITYAGRAFQQPMLINDPKADANFKSYEIAASKRLADRWQFMASFSATKLDIPYVSNTGGGLAVSLTTFDPNAEIFAADKSWEWLGRASGAYLFPADVQVSANFERRSGASQARTVSFTGGQQIPSITLRVEPIGAFRLPNLNILHLRAEKSFRVRQGHKMALRLNVFNALNINTVLTQNLLSGSNFLRPTSITPPRIAEFSVSYDF